MLSNKSCSFEADHKARTTLLAAEAQNSRWSRHPQHKHATGKECQAERAVLSRTHLLELGLSSWHSYLHGEDPTRIQTSNSRQHAEPYLDGLQLVPQKTVSQAF